MEDPGDVDRGYAVAGAISTAGGDALVVIAADHEEDWLAERLRAGGSIVFVLGGEDVDGADAVARAVRRFGVLRSFATVCQTFPPRHGTTLWLVTWPSGALRNRNCRSLPPTPQFGVRRECWPTNAPVTSSSGSPGSEATTSKAMPTAWRISSCPRRTRTRWC